MMNWANTIRKRHVREFAKLQHDRKEMQLLKERTEGYKESMKEDKAREEREERELQAKKEEEEKERLRKEKLEQRRQELLEALPEEPEAGSEGVITIALRFGDGSRDQRRFVAEETSVNDVFNWVDATHGLEREKIELSTDISCSPALVHISEEFGNLDFTLLRRHPFVHICIAAGCSNHAGNKEPSLAIDTANIVTVLPTTMTTTRSSVCHFQHRE